MTNRTLACCVLLAFALVPVPKGTVLLSLKKKVTSSDSQPVIGEVDMIRRARSDRARSNPASVAAGRGLS